ncbi:hypothetical protein D884_03221 [Pseudomonas sp. URMO17WK12:I10]|uniref:hypothetical protein n=1 Tax=unclassified Pseudomonas TaxID=196821 RepID=UPI0004ACDC45|nr:MULTISPECIES: hypothetical protein [unclassified Pseudomonas]RDL17028.1 hypothetical protein F633_03441 [Pseudomonas sp. LAMO17WK12:I3]RED05110.1 hypothetical protein D884_03221 [Pseudomonas sp. URMO17WK12:I10]SOD08496.1 hypothetical protein SAMN05660967_01705 [Pseudomonas sp. URMO17WK12:I9]
MPKALLREVAMDCISDMAQHLPGGCELFVIACRPGKGDFDLVLPSPEANLDNAVDALRRQGLSIDGNNIYKQAICEFAVGAMTLGKHGSNPPPSGHWGQQFWDIGRAEGQQRDDLVVALQHLIAVTTPDANGQIGAKEEHLAALEHARSMIRLHHP